jgi:hypothetical protein
MLRVARYFSKKTPPVNNVLSEWRHTTKTGREIWLESEPELHVVEHLQRYARPQTLRQIHGRISKTPVETLKRAVLDLEHKGAVERVGTAPLDPSDIPLKSGGLATRPASDKTGIKGPGGMDLAMVHRLVGDSARRDAFGGNDDKHHFIFRVLWQLRDEK